MLLLFVTGMMFGWTSPYIVQLTAEDSPLSVTLHEASWIVSLLTLGRLAGAIPGAVCMDYFGGKKTLIIIGLPLTLSWICVIMADSIPWLYAARFLGGIGLGMSFSSFPIFLGEICSPKIRGTVVSFAVFGLPVGTLAGNSIGPYITMVEFAYVCLIPTVIFILICAWIPESPHYLVRKKRMESAKVSIVGYNPGANAEVELKSLKDFIETSYSMSFIDQLREFNIPANRKAGIIVILLYMFMQFSGVNVVIFYTEAILIQGKWSMTLPSTMVIIASTTGIIAGLAAIYLADRCGRKTLMLFSSTGVSISMLGLGLHFALLDSGFDPVALQWLMMSCLIIYEVVFWIGLSPVPSMVSSELFAPNIKSIAACFGSSSVGLFSFISTKAYQPLLDSIGTVYVFSLYAGLMMLSMLFVLTIMPETKGKSLQEIQNKLHKKYVAVSTDNCEDGHKSEAS